MECHDFHEKKNEKNKKIMKIIIIKTPLLCKVIVKLAIKQHVNGTIWDLRFLRIEQYTEQWLLLMLEGYQTCGIGRDSKNKNIYIKIKI